MTKAAPDYSFVREGVPLAEWLWRLVGDDAAARVRAGDVLQAMSYGVPSPETDLATLDPVPDFAAQSQRFGRAVRDAVAAPAPAPRFDTAEFVRRLCTRRVAQTDDWLRRVGSARAPRSDEQLDRIAERLLKRINDAAADEATRARANERLDRAIAARVARDCRVDKQAYDGAEAMTNASLMAGVVFGALGAELLAAPDALQLVLGHPQHAREALEALARIGPPAIAFAPQLIERIDHLPPQPYFHGFDAAEALGSIGRGHAGIVDALVQRLRDADPQRRAAAAETLAVMGKDVAGRGEKILALLHEILADRDDPGWPAALTALASVGRDDPASRRQVIDLARPRPPEMVSPPDFPDSRYDRATADRGVAIDALQFLAGYPDECVPVLVDAIENFQEYNPDECYRGPLGRIARALGKFGPAAGPTAALPLARHLADDPGDFPRAILDALAAMGPAAAAAVPLLEAFRARARSDARARSADETQPPPDWPAPAPAPAPAPDADLDPIGHVLRQIVGAPR